MYKSVTGRSCPHVFRSETCERFNTGVVEETALINGSIGQPVNKATRFKRCRIDEFSEEHPLPTSEEYTLDGLLASAAPLTEVACEHLLDSSDVLDLQNQGVQGTLFDTLKRYQENREVRNPESLSPDSPAAAAAAELNNEIVEPNKD